MIIYAYHSTQYMIVQLHYHHAFTFVNHFLIHKTILQESQRLFFKLLICFWSCSPLTTHAQDNIGKTTIGFVSAEYLTDGLPLLSKCCLLDVHLYISVTRRSTYAHVTLCTYMVHMHSSMTIRGAYAYICNQTKCICKDLCTHEVSMHRSMHTNDACIHVVLSTYDVHMHRSMPI